MKLTLIILITLILTSPVLADDWDTVDKTLLGVLISTKTIDCFQTRWIFDKDEWHELNPIIREGVDRYGKGFIPAYFLVTTLGTALIADWLPSDYRKAWLGIWVGASGTTVHRNYVLGVKMKF